MNQTPILSDNYELEENVFFEVSKTVTLTSKIRYRKEDVISMLTAEIQELKIQMADLKKTKILTTKESLVKL